MKAKLSGRTLQALRVFLWASVLTYFLGNTTQFQEVELDLYDTRMYLWQTLIEADPLDQRIFLTAIKDETRANGWNDQKTLEFLKRLDESGVGAVLVCGDDVFLNYAEVKDELPQSVLVLSDFSEVSRKLGSDSPLSAMNGEAQVERKLLFGDAHDEAVGYADVDGIVRTIPAGHPSFLLVRELAARLGQAQFRTPEEEVAIEFEPIRGLLAMTETNKLFPSSVDSVLENLEDSRIAQKAVQGRVVLLGVHSQAANLYEVKTCFGALQPSQMYALMLNTLLDGWQLNEAEPWSVHLTNLFLIALVAFTLSGRRPKTVAMTGFSFLVLLAISSLFLLPADLNTPVAQHIFAVFLAVLLLIFLEFRRTRQVLESFGGTEDAVLSGEETEASILFTFLPKFLLDIEKREDEGLLARRADYTTLLLSIARKYHGQVLDYQGDAQMIGFGLRLDDDREHAAEATAAALEIVSSVPFLAEAWNVPAEELQVHAGVCTGTVALGHVGAAGKQDLAAIGDTTNTAARLMGAAMKLDRPVIVARTTFEAADGLIQGEELPPVELKGKTAPVEVFAAEAVDEQWRTENIQKDKERVPRGGTITYSGERRSDLYATVGFALAGFLLMLFVRNFGFTQTLELRSYDQAVRTLLKAPPDPRIVIASVDEEAVQKLGPYPWSRRVYAQIIANLEESGYKGLFLDLFLRKNSKSDPEGDALLARMVRGEPRVVLAGTLPEVSRGVYGDPIFYDRLDPVRLWKNGQVGLAHKRLDVDERLRWGMLAHPETLSHDRRFYPSSALALLIDSAEELAVTPSGLRLEERLIPSTTEGRFQNEILIRFGTPATGPKASPQAGYRHISVWELVDPNQPIHKELDGAYVFVGVNFQEGDYAKLDLVETPVGQIKGVEAHARIFDTVLNENYISRVPDGFNVFWMALVAAGTTFILARYRTAQEYLPKLALLAGCVLFVYVVLLLAGYWSHLIYPLVVIVGVTGAVLVGRYLLTFNTLRRFVPDEFADELLFLHGVRNRRLNATVLLTDIRGYTTLSEGRSAVGMLDVLNEYHRRTVECYERHGGKALTYQGDAQIVVFGVFGKRANPARDAVAAALELQAICDQLRSEWGIESREDFDVGAGLCTGEVEVGRLGGESNRQISVVGETVRQTHKVQSLSADLNAPVILDQPTLDACSGEVKVDDLGMVQPKGLSREIRLYRAVAVKTEES